MLLALLLAAQGPALSRAEGLDGKVWVGYQGWFNAEGDGAGRGWTHWTKKPRQPFDLANAKIDLWPDVSELGPDERFATGLGREVFSSFKPATVKRHFKWMKDYGIDGAFVQRFIVDLRDARARAHVDAVLEACRAGANEQGRQFAVMYDLSGMKSERMGELAADWKGIGKIVDDPRYLRHRGKPLVAVWGVGFSDGRGYTLADTAAFLELLKAGGCSVMLGVPTYWRELHRDAVKDPALHDVLRKADVVSPWTVGRFATPAQAASHGEKVIAPDLAWCEKEGVDYLPVVFPGFSWHHMNGKPLNEIPRLKGEFLWSQFAAAKRAGASSVYVAMFDEVDEATAIFKCVNDPPGAFVTYEGLPSDFYLKLTGDGGRLLRGEIEKR